MPKCYICNLDLKPEMQLTANDDLTMGFYAIVVRNTQIGICSDCFKKWNKALEFLLSRFKEQQHIDEEICKKILEYKNEK